MAIEPITGFYVYDEETDTDGVAKVSIEAVHEFVEDVSGAVDTWLDDHPEATTTVQDDSLTTDKYKDESVTVDKLAPASVVEGKVNVNFLKEIKNAYITPEMFGAVGDGVTNDSEALQSVVNYALENNYMTIVLGKKYNITGATIKVTKGLYEVETHERKRLTLIGLGDGTVFKSDSGYMFSAESFSGDYNFINLHFLGNGGNTRCSVFDCHKMIRINTYGCTYCKVGWVFDGSESVDGSSNMQSVKNYGDTCTYSFGYYLINYLWDVSSYGCLVEQCEYAYKTGDTTGGVIQSLTISETTIEGNSSGGIIFGDNPGGIANLSIGNCYFESNGQYDIKIDCPYTYTVNITGNKFTPSDQGHCVDILVRNDSWTIDSNYSTSSAQNATFLFVRTEANTPIPFKIFGTNTVGGTVVKTNNTNIVVDLKENGVIKRYPKFSDTLAGNSLNFASTNLNDGFVTINNDESIENLPAGETGGSLLNHYYDGYAYQFFIGGNRTTPYFRTRKKGVGWSDWNMTTPTAFYRTNLTDSTSVNLDYPAQTKSLVVFRPEYSSANNILQTFPSTTVNKGATSFTFYARKSTDGTPSTLTHQGWFILIPIV